MSQAWAPGTNRPWPQTQAGSFMASWTHCKVCRTAHERLSRCISQVLEGASRVWSVAIWCSTRLECGYQVQLLGRLDPHSSSRASHKAPFLLGTLASSLTALLAPDRLSSSR